MNNFKENLINIGKINKTHGILGELKISINGNIDMKNYPKNELIYIEFSDDYFESIEVEKYFIKSGKHLLKLKDLNNINDVLKYINKNIFIDKKSVFYEIKKNNIYFKPTIKDNDLDILRIIDTLDNGFYTNYKLQINNKNIWVPGVEKYIFDIDYDNEVIVFQNLEELY